MTWKAPENPQKLFEELDKGEYNFFAEALWAYMRALMDQGFTRREALKLTELYSKFVHEMSMEEFFAREAERKEFRDVDSDEDEGVE